MPERRPIIDEDVHNRISGVVFKMSMI